MELAESSLTDIMKTIPETTGNKYFKDICEGLKFLHGQNLIHRDLKPDNILISKKGVAKLSDFGITKKTENTYVSLSDRVNMFGTFRYLPPEVMNGEKYNQKCDIWALGIIYYEMLTQGIKLFEGTREEIINKVTKRQFSIESIIKNPQNLAILGGIFF